MSLLYHIFLLEEPFLFKLLNLNIVFPPSPLPFLVILKRVSICLYSEALQLLFLYAHTLPAFPFIKVFAFFSTPMLSAILLMPKYSLLLLDTRK